MIKVSNLCLKVISSIDLAELSRVHFLLVHSVDIIKYSIPGFRQPILPAKIRHSGK
jgi:hypothetical protein